MNRFAKTKIIEARTKHLEENMKPLGITKQIDSYVIANKELDEGKTYLKYDIKF